MTTLTAECASCRTPLGAADAFCRLCGEPAPTTRIDGEFAAAGRRVDPEEDQLYRTRLARALSAQFEVRGQIGEGGYGVVYEAFDRRLGRSLAVKVLRHELAVEGGERFITEAKVVASLRHPHIVPVHFLGEAEGIVFLTMPLLGGRTLRARLREGPIAPDDARRILGEIADALEAAHAAGVIHRDLKPENIFLEGPAERVVLMDFGIAKVATEAAHTLTGVIVGTPVYMSPEQFSGGAAVDARADLYALGVIGFEMLTGRPPFRGETIPQLIYQHLEEPPDAAALERSGADAMIREVVLHCLAKSPERRPASASAIRAVLAPMRHAPEPGRLGAAERALCWMWTIGICAWPPALLAWSKPFYVELVADPERFGTVRNVMSAVLYTSIYPFNVLALLLLLVAVVGVWRAWRELRVPAESSWKRFARLMLGPMGALERILVALIILVTFAANLFVLPTFEAMARSIGADVPMLLSTMSTFMQRWFLPCVIGVIGAAVIERNRTGGLHATRLAVRCYVALLSLYIWFAAVSGI